MGQRNGIEFAEGVLLGHDNIKVITEQWLVAHCFVAWILSGQIVQDCNVSPFGHEVDHAFSWFVLEHEDFQLRVRGAQQ